MQCHPLQGFRSDNIHLVAMVSRLMAWPPPTGIEPSPLPRRTQLDRRWRVHPSRSQHHQVVMKLPGFPQPIPYPINGRRWRPEDHFAFRRGLMEAVPAKSRSACEPLPGLDLGEFLEKREREKEATRRGKVA
jgi:hypothetical protein